MRITITDSFINKLLLTINLNFSVTHTPEELTSYTFDKEGVEVYMRDYRTYYIKYSQL